MSQTRCKKIIYIQYANPACYPPLEHSSHILATSGWKVVLLGVGSLGPSNDFHLRPHANITAHRLPFVQGGLLQKLHYIFFCLWGSLAMTKAGPTLNKVYSKGVILFDIRLLSKKKIPRSIAVSLYSSRGIFFEAAKLHFFKSALNKGNNLLNFIF